MPTEHGVLATAGEEGLWQVSALGLMEEDRQGCTAEDSCTCAEGTGNTRFSMTSFEQENEWNWNALC